MRIKISCRFMRFYQTKIIAIIFFWRNINEINEIKGKRITNSRFFCRTFSSRKYLQLIICLLIIFNCLSKDSIDSLCLFLKCLSKMALTFFKIIQKVQEIFTYNIYALDFLKVVCWFGQIKSSIIELKTWIEELEMFIEWLQIHILSILKMLTWIFELVKSI